MPGGQRQGLEVVREPECVESHAGLVELVCVEPVAGVHGGQQLPEAAVLVPTATFGNLFEDNQLHRVGATGTAPLVSAPMLLLILKLFLDFTIFLRAF